MGEIRRNSVAFWLLGLCNNFAYVIMLSAAKDILEKNSQQPEKPCRSKISTRQCELMSTGAVLLADIVPALFIKLSAPIFIHRVPFGLRHFLVVFLQTASFLIVGFSDTTWIALFGVVLASFGSGLGEISYLALTANYENTVISSWSSGTGGAGIVGALVYALLTDSKFLNFTPKNAMFSMLLVPGIFALTYWNILKIPAKIHKIRIFEFATWIVPEERNESREALLDEQEEGEEVDNFEKSTLWKYMVPLITVYLAEYYINQGMLELLEFSCSTGFSMSPSSQYRWFQVTYQLGVFVSRSSSDFVKIPSRLLGFLAGFQMLNAIFFTTTAISPIIPHISFAFLLIFFEGILGGASYVNTFRAVHEEIPSKFREYSMGFVSISDTIGIVLAGFLSMPIHNKICGMGL